MRIRRLGWAGVELEASGESLVIDLLQDSSPLTPFVGEPQDELPGPQAEGRMHAALVTHLHADHADPPSIARALAPDGVVLRPPPADGDPVEVAGVAGAEELFADAGLRMQVMEPWETVEVGPFSIAALPAVDGLGDPQLSYAVRADGRTIVHCGDTLFHGYWWSAARRHGPFDLAFLPVNGPVVDFPHRRPPSPLPAAMAPEHAAAAGRALRAAEVVPMHHTAFHSPPLYAEVDDPLGNFLAAAQRLGVAARMLTPGEAHDLGAGDEREAA